MTETGDGWAADDGAPDPPGLAGLVTGAEAGGSPGAHGDEYSCARAWAALTAAHARITGHLSAALAQACGLSINDFEILLRLNQVPLPGARLGGLTSAVRLTQPALSRAIARLERRGWLRRAGARDDRRGVLVAITPAGQEILRRAVPVHAQTIRDFLLDPLTPEEQDMLARALARVAGADAKGLQSAAGGTRTPAGPRKPGLRVTPHQIVEASGVPQTR